MKIKDYPNKEILRRCKKGTLFIKIGAFNFSIQSPIGAVSHNLIKLYSEFTVLDEHALIDFEVLIKYPNTLRRWIKPQVNFYCDGKAPFLPLPASQAFPFLEWGLNWCIAQHSLQYLSLHAAVLENKGACIILPAESGSGKSTLTALLMADGWRLLSDEMTLISTKNAMISPLARPVSLKNESISLLQQSWPDAVFGDIVDDTNKGTISHLKATDVSTQKMLEQASPTTIVFPKYQAGAAMKATPKDKALAFMAVIENSFNYGLLREQGFNTLNKVVQQCECYDFTYSETPDALAFFRNLVNNHE